MILTPDEFVRKWADVQTKERATAQSHFEDLCRMVGHPLPHDMDPTGEAFGYEVGMKTSDDRQGFADVFYKNHFAMEYKGRGVHKTLDDAYVQLLRYRENLNNPPLLVVCDIDRWQIHTNFPNTAKKVYEFKHADITQNRIQQILRHLFFNPNALHPDKTAEQVTADAARVFEKITANMRDWQAEPDRIAHFLTKLVFSLFAEDVDLLPTEPNGGRGLFSEIVQRTSKNPIQFKRYVGELFSAMAEGGNVLMLEVPYFNGALFEDVQVEELSAEALLALESASRLDWSSVEPAIFGTLFERSLDPSKRAQLGAHYTSRADILLIVEPVLMEPLRREWAAIRAEAETLRPAFDDPTITPAVRIKRGKDLEALRTRMLEKVRTITVLDPACGSGNFLYVALNLLLDFEKAVINDPVFAGLTTVYPEVHPRQLYGIEINPIAHALASIVVWIGYIQWRKNNGYLAFSVPILEALANNIRQMDAVLQYDADGKPFEPEWPSTEVIVGNPPFLGDKKMRGELTDAYVSDLRKLYKGRVPGGADFVTYWFEKSRAQIEAGKTKRAGLLSTNSIRGGANREVLSRIKETGDIFMAWRDREWILDGAAVRVSMVGFDNGQETSKTIDGEAATAISSDLEATVDITKAKRLGENTNISFIGVQKSGPFDINESLAKQMIASTNSSGLSNSDVIRKIANAQAVTNWKFDSWIIDFAAMSQEDAAKYEAPYEYVLRHVKPERDTNRRDRTKRLWWIHGENRPGMRHALKKLNRYIITPRVAKHRLFAWVTLDVLPDSATVVFAREDDYFFGVLHSRLHEVWSLRMGTWLGKGNDPRYTPTTTFETFPFPWAPGAEDTSSPAYQRISAAAKQLHAERDAWLNPPGVSEKALKDRTLTNLYNALNVFRGKEKMKIKSDAGDFAPRLDALHRELDAAVVAAYGWDASISDDEEAILRHLLALNLSR